MKGQPRLGPGERAVMQVLWADPEQELRVRDVVDRLANGTAYTTIMTMLDRLHGKGLVSRRRVGRAWSYLPEVTREAYAAKAMSEALRSDADADGVLVHFVGQLSPEEQAELRRLLERG